MTSSSTSRHVSGQSGHFDLEPGHTPENPKVRRLSSPASYHPFFGGLMRDSRILDLLTPLIGPAIRAQGDKLNMKPADGGSPVEWHQDFAHYPHTNDDLCAVGIALDDATRGQRLHDGSPRLAPRTDPRSPSRRLLHRRHQSQTATISTSRRLCP